MVSFLALSQGEEDITCEASYCRGFDLVFAKLPNAQQKVQFFKKESYRGDSIETEETVPEGS